MDNQLQGVKVTYIETQYVTSDAAGFKDLVQRLTGRSPTGATPINPAPAAAPHRPRARRAAQGGRTTTAAGPAPLASYQYRPAAAEVHQTAVNCRAPACQEDLLLAMDDFSDLFYVGASDQRRQILNSGYNDFHY